MNRSTPITRRAAIQGTLASATALTLPNILRWRASANEAGSQTADTAVIFVQLGGGASQHETYDPKPNAAAEFRGAMKPIGTSVPGISICELLPKQASLMKHLAVVRSITHREASHIALHMVETGYFLRVPGNSRKGEMPSMGSCISRVRGPGRGGLPANVSLPKPFAYSGPHYLGGAHAGFGVDDDPNKPDFRVANLSLAKGLDSQKLGDRQALLKSFDSAKSVLDTDGGAEAMDAFQKRALDLITGEHARTAFDLSRELAALRDAYGRNEFGQRLLLARRLTEAGVPFVTIRMGDWDDHDKLTDRMKKRAPIYDAGIAALVKDLLDRGLNKRVLVVAMGEFGRTPRMNPNGGRDHWPGVASVMLAGGEYQMGQAIGSTDTVGGTVASAPYPPQSVLAMAYLHLGIDPATTFPDFTGRPRYLLEEREPIRELV